MTIADHADPPLLTGRHGHVLVLTLNRPRVGNAVNLAMAQAVGDALERAEQDREVRAVVVTGAGERAFCAGVDVAAISRGEPVIPDDPRRAAWGFAGYVSHPVSKPTIAAVNGPALGGGTEIVLASDLAVAADTASFGLPEVGLGVYAGGGGAFRLPAQIPRKIALEMLFTGDAVSAERACALGLVNRVVPAATVLDAAVELAERICRNAPLAVQATKRVAHGIVGGAVAAERPSWSLSERELGALMRSADAREGTAAFVGKRAPRWRAE